MNTHNEKLIDIGSASLNDQGLMNKHSENYTSI